MKSIIWVTCAKQCNEQMIANRYELGLQVDDYAVKRAAKSAYPNLTHDIDGCFWCCKDINSD